MNYIKIDETTFVNAYEDYWKELYLLCNRYVQDTELSKELIQELFISIWEKRDSLQIHTSLKSYLFSALKLKIMEHYRKQAVRDRYVAYKVNSDLVHDKHLTEQQVYFNDLQQSFYEVVNSLPERSRQVYQLSRDKGMDNKSIAAALMITEKAVEGNITRALAYIRKKLHLFRRE